MLQTGEGRRGNGARDESRAKEWGSVRLTGWRLLLQTGEGSRGNSEDSARDEYQAKLGANVRPGGQLSLQTGEGTEGTGQGMRIGPRDGGESSLGAEYQAR